MTATQQPSPLLQCVDARRQGAGDHETTSALQELREKLSPRGDLVSPRGRVLTEQVFGAPLTPSEVVLRICDDVRKTGTEAVLRYGAALDKANLTREELRVPAEAFIEAHRSIDTQLLDSIRRIRDNIQQFQKAILHRDVKVTPRPGVSLWQRYVPLRRVGVCVPGGAAAYPSTVLMTVVPAQVAGVKEIAIVAPPTAFGAYNPVMLATCHELGITEIYRVGGAQGVAALAYGCDAIPAVDKIVGPGSLFVALAKKHVYGTVDIDSFAGPSEVIVIADHTANPEYVAADLLAQAEHSPGSAILITWHEPLIALVEAALTRQLANLQRAELTLDSLKSFGAMILVRDADHACQLTDQFAPEHLHIQTETPEDLLKKIRNAGATFLGDHTPVALGDYAAGPSHVLPTGGTCTWAAGLSSNSFLRSGSVTQFDAHSLGSVAEDVERLANEEGLTAHAHSVSIRRVSICHRSSTESSSVTKPSLFRSALSRMQPYTPGEQPRGGELIKLNTNENPYPPPPAVVDAIREAALGPLNRYPNPMAQSFRVAAAETLGLPGPEWILAGNGSDEILTMLVRGFVGEGERLRLPFPSYILYRTLADIQGADWEQVSFNDDWSLPAAFSTNDEKLKLVLLPNPNSPSGTMLAPREVEKIGESLDCPLVVDEAYVDFAEENCIDLVRRNEWIMVTRTLSKSYALAGIRFGYLVAQPHVISELAKIKDSYNCDMISIAAATAAMQSGPWLAGIRQKMISTRERMTLRLSQLGFCVTPSKANFVWCQHPDGQHQAIYEHCKEGGYLIRFMVYPGYGDGLRISVGTDEQVDACLDLIQQWLAAK